METIKMYIEMLFAFIMSMVALVVVLSPCIIIALAIYAFVK
jgi:hypothetical protein